MVISNLNIDRITELLRIIEDYIKELRQFVIMTEEEFLSDKKILLSRKAI